MQAVAQQAAGAWRTVALSLALCLGLGLGTVLAALFGGLIIDALMLPSGWGELAFEGEVTKVGADGLVEVTTTDGRKLEMWQVRGGMNADYPTLGAQLKKSAGDINYIELYAAGTPDARELRRSAIDPPTSAVLFLGIWAGAIVLSAGALAALALRLTRPKVRDGGPR